MKANRSFIQLLFFVSIASFSLIGCGEVEFADKKVEAVAGQGTECPECPAGSQNEGNRQDEVPGNETPPGGENPGQGGGPGGPGTTPGGSEGPSGPEGPTNPKNTDPENKELLSCIGQRNKVIYEDIAVDPSPEVMNIYDQRGMLFLNRNRSVDISINDFRGILRIDRAERVREFNNVRGIVQLTARNVERINDVRSLMLINAVNLGAINGEDRYGGALGVVARTVGDIKNVRGLSCISAESVGTISNIRGGTRILGPKEGGTVESIEDIRGITWVRNMHISHIKNVRGLVVLVDSSADEISNIRGHVVLINSRVGLENQISGQLHRR